MTTTSSDPAAQKHLFDCFYVEAQIVDAAFRFLIAANGVDEMIRVYPGLQVGVCLYAGLLRLDRDEVIFSSVANGFIAA
nr:hypothetical protein [Rhodococcus sp. 06-418-1B]